MKYALQSLDNLIGIDGECDNEGVRNIIDQIKSTVYSLSSEEEVRLYIRNHQVALLKKQCHECVFNKCDYILFFLESHFFYFLDKELPISESGRNKLLRQSEALRINIKKFVLESIHADLVKLLQPLLFPESKKVVSIRKANYIAHFWENWSLYFSDQESFSEQKIIDYLIAYNFNPHAFSEYLISGIISQISEFDQPEIQTELLEARLSHFKRIPVSSVGPYILTFPAVATILDDWLKEEIKKGRKRLKNLNPNQLSILPKSNYKIETSLSVAQLACLLHSMYDAGLITNASQSEILQVVTKMISCKKTDQISFRSLHNKYYEIEDKTKESVKELLKDLVRKM